MDELISKQAAVGAIEKLCEECDSTWCGECRIKYPGKDARSVLKSLPPAEPKRGKWILDRSGAYCCSECMEPCATYVMMQPRDKYCKMCGAKMEVTE